MAPFSFPAERCFRQSRGLHRLHKPSLHLDSQILIMTQVIVPASSRPGSRQLLSQPRIAKSLPRVSQRAKRCIYAFIVRLFERNRDAYYLPPEVWLIVLENLTKPTQWLPCNFNIRAKLVNGLAPEIFSVNRNLENLAIAHAQHSAKLIVEDSIHYTIEDQPDWRVRLPSTFCHVRNVELHLAHVHRAKDLAPFVRELEAIAEFERNFSLVDTICRQVPAHAKVSIIVYLEIHEGVGICEAVLRRLHRRLLGAHGHVESSRVYYCEFGELDDDDEMEENDEDDEWRFGRRTQLAMEYCAKDRELKKIAGEIDAAFLRDRD